MGMLYTLTLSSFGVYGILFSEWSANSKYAFYVQSEVVLL